LWSPQQGPVGPGEWPAGLGKWGFSPRTLSISRFGCRQSRFQKDRQGRQMRTAQRRREPRPVSGQISVSWFAARSNELSLPAKVAIGPRVFLLLWKSRVRQFCQGNMTCGKLSACQKNGQKPIKRSGRQTNWKRRHLAGLRRLARPSLIRHRWKTLSFAQGYDFWPQ